MELVACRGKLYGNENHKRWGGMEAYYKSYNNQ